MGMEIFFQPFFFPLCKSALNFCVVMLSCLMLFGSFPAFYLLLCSLILYFYFSYLFLTYHVWVIWYFIPNHLVFHSKSFSISFQRLIIAVWCMNGSYYWYPLMDHGYSWYLLRSKFKMLDGSTCINHAVDILKFFHTSVDLVNLGQWGSLMFEISNLWDWGNTWLFSWCVNHSIGALFKWIHLVLIYPLQGGLCEILFTLHLVMHWALFTH